MFKLISTPFNVVCWWCLIWLKCTIHTERTKKDILIVEIEHVKCVSSNPFGNIFNLSLSEHEGNFNTIANFWSFTSTFAQFLSTIFRFFLHSCCVYCILIFNPLFSSPEYVSYFIDSPNFLLVILSPSIGKLWIIHS